MWAVPEQTRDAAGVRLPDFFIVGAPKSGTTSLYWMLRQHPQIFMPDLKEPQFFASDPPPRRELVDKLPREAKRPHTLQEYLSLFEDARPEQRVGESSTFYISSHTAAARIAELQPQARIIAILREPVAFLRSLHLTLLLIAYETETDLRKAMSLQAARREGGQIPRHCVRPQLLQYSEHVRYTEQLRRFEDRFPPGHLLVLITDDLWGDTEATIRQVLRFLEVDDEHPIAPVNTNVTKRAVRAPWLRDALESAAAWRGPPRPGRGEALLRRTVRSVRRRAMMGETPPLDAQFALELRRRFKGEVEALGDYLGRDLVRLWGYEEVN
jgi:Sulfotransferase family